MVLRLEYWTFMLNQYVSNDVFNYVMPDDGCVGRTHRKSKTGKSSISSDSFWKDGDWKELSVEKSIWRADAQGFVVKTISPTNFIQFLGWNQY